MTAFNQSDYCIDQSNCRTLVTCQNKFTTPPHQYGCLLATYENWSQIPLPYNQVNLLCCSLRKSYLTYLLIGLGQWILNRLHIYHRA